MALPLDAGHDPPGSTSNALSTRDVFEFFDLSRELRDMVYACLLEEDDHVWRHKTTQGEQHIACNRVDFPKPLGISKQFSSEYQAQADRSTGQLLTVSDTQFSNPNCNNTFMNEIPRAFLRADHLRLNLFLYGGEDGDQCHLDHHWEWMVALVGSLHRLQSISVRIQPGHTDVSNGWWQKSLERLESSPIILNRLECVEVYPVLKSSGQKLDKLRWLDFSWKRNDVIMKWCLKEKKFYECEKGTEGKLN